MQKSKLLTLLLCTLVGSGFVLADPIASGTAQSTGSKAVSSSTAPTAEVTLQASTPLTVSLLDKFWSKRENPNNQRAIADYLMTQPSVANDYATAWKTARLVYFIGNYGAGEQRFVDSDAGVTLFNYGAQAGKLAQSLNPNGVEGYYWYAIDLGSWGLAKGILASASNAKYGIAALNKANQINPAYQWYGSSRILGRYYQQLPGLFGGDSAKALALFTTATEQAPKFSSNWVFLGQYYMDQGQYAKALAACNLALSLSPLDGKYEELRYRADATTCKNKSQSKLN